MLSREQLKVINMVGTGMANISEAMKITGKDRTMWYHWIKNPEFVAELTKTQQETKNQARQEFDRLLPSAIKELWDIAQTADNRTKKDALIYIIDRSLGRIKTSSDDDNNIDDDNTNVKSMLQEVQLEIKEEEEDEENKPPSEVSEKKTA